MNLIFLGALHDAPFGKNNLSRTIDRLRSEYQCEPNLVAFEYAEATYKALKVRRPELKRKIEIDFPKLKKNFIELFSNTLAYEPDIGLTLPPSTKHIWLLNGHTDSDLSVKGQHARFQNLTNPKIVNLQSWVLRRIKNWKNLNNEELLSTVTSVYMEESKRIEGLQQIELELEGSIQKGRESFMFNSLKEAAGTPINDDSYGIVIIGTSHLLNLTDTLYNQCLREGYAVSRIWPHEQ